MSPYLIAEQNRDSELMELMKKYKSVNSDNQLGGCTFLGLCAPSLGSSSTLRSVQTCDSDLFEL